MKALVLLHFQKESGMSTHDFKLHMQMNDW